MLSQNRLTFRNIFTEVFDGNKKTDGLSRKKKSNIDKSEINLNKTQYPEFVKENRPFQEDDDKTNTKKDKKEN